jgi:hypothetical protein
MSAAFGRDIMDDTEIHRSPAAVRDIVADTERAAFGMISEAKVGALLATLAASKPGLMLVVRRGD